MYKIKKGKWGEDKAVDLLVRKGYSIIERNYRCRWGEIDIIAEKSGAIHFVEVKTRSSADFGSPLESIGWDKMHHIMRTAQYYIHTNALGSCEISLDAIGIYKDEIDFVQGINM